MDYAEITDGVIHAWKPVEDFLNKLVEIGYSSGFFDYLDREYNRERAVNIDNLMGEL